MDKLFVYGTLIDDKARIELLGKTHKVTKDILTGYTSDASIEIEDELFPVIKKEKNSSVSGLLVHGLSLEDFEILDGYETDEYKKITVKLFSGRLSYVYVKNNK